MKRKMTSKDLREQGEIIKQWVKDCAIAYNISINDVTDSHIISYLAQVQLGFH
jgi:hypothetical protein